MLQMKIFHTLTQTAGLCFCNTDYPGSYLFVEVSLMFGMPRSLSCSRS